MPKEGLPIVLWCCVGEGVTNNREENLDAHVSTDSSGKAQHHIDCQEFRSGERELWRVFFREAVYERQCEQERDGVIEERDHRHVSDVPPQSHHLPHRVRWNQEQSDANCF